MAARATADIAARTAAADVNRAPTAGTMNIQSFHSRRRGIRGRRRRSRALAVRGQPWLLRPPRATAAAPLVPEPGPSSSGAVVEQAIGRAARWWRRWDLWCATHISHLVCYDRVS